MQNTYSTHMTKKFIIEFIFDRWNVKTQTFANGGTIQQVSLLPASCVFTFVHLCYSQRDKIKFFYCCYFAAFVEIVNDV